MASRSRARVRTRRVSFRVVNTHKHVTKPDPGEVLLERDLWDDFGYRCSFNVFIADGSGHRLLGTWKILDRTLQGERTTELPRAFTQLPPEFVSLGQQLVAYEALAGLPRKLALAI